MKQFIFTACIFAVCMFNCVVSIGLFVDFSLFFMFVWLYSIVPVTNLLLS